MNTANRMGEQRNKKRFKTIKIMKTYNTLDEIFKDARTHQVTAQELLNGRTHVNGEWQAIALSNSLRKQICECLSEMFGGRKGTKQRVYTTLMYSRPQHWGLARAVISDYGKGARLEYMAGQDQPWENKEIRNALK